MKYRQTIRAINVSMGILIILVGVLHFLVLGHLRDWIFSQVNSKDAENVFAAFSINHIASGVFLILLGVTLTYSSFAGLEKDKRWAAPIVIFFGVTLSLLSVVLWATVPKMFLEAVAFRIALISLFIIGVVMTIPMLFYKKYCDT